MTAITLHPILDMTPVETDKGVRFRHTDDAACMWRGRKYRIPSGCLTDFASIPRWLRPIAGQVGRHAAAATFHDVATRMSCSLRFLMATTTRCGSPPTSPQGSGHDPS